MTTDDDLFKCIRIISVTLLIFVVAVGLVIFLSSCTQFEAVKKDILNEPEEICVCGSNFTEIQNTICTYEECICEECGDLSSISIFLDSDEILNQIVRFSNYADNYLYCQLIILEDAEVANVFIQKFDAGVDVKLTFDQQNTMTQCDVSCLPRAKSYYNEVYASGLNVEVVTNIHSNYCISEDGFIFFSKNINENAELKDMMFYFQSNIATEVLIDEFNRLRG